MSYSPSERHRQRERKQGGGLEGRCQRAAQRATRCIKEALAPESYTRAGSLHAGLRETSLHKKNNQTRQTSSDLRKVSQLVPGVYAIHKIVTAHPVQRVAASLFS